MSNNTATDLKENDITEFLMVCSVDETSPPFCTFSKQHLLKVCDVQKLENIINKSQKKFNKKDFKLKISNEDYNTYNHFKGIIAYRLEPFKYYNRYYIYNNVKLKGFNGYDCDTDFLIKSLEMEFIWFKLPNKTEPKYYRCYNAKLNSVIKKEVHHINHGLSPYIRVHIYGTDMFDLIKYNKDDLIDEFRVNKTEAKSISDTIETPIYFISEVFETQKDWLNDMNIHQEPTIDEMLTMILGDAG